MIATISELRARKSALDTADTDDDGETADAESGQRGKKKPSEPKQAELVIRAVENIAELFHCSKKIGYAKIHVRSEDAARDITFKLRSPAFQQWCAAHVRREFGKSLGSAAIEEAVLVLQGIALYDRAERAIFTRCARVDDRVFIDIGDDTGDVIAIEAGKWEIVSSSAIDFIRPPALRPLPRPVRGGDIRELRRFVNVASDDDFALVIGWALGALGNQGRPNPALILGGEQGSSKTTTSRIVRELVDPSIASVRRPPREEEALAVAACNTYVLAFDNLSGVDGWLSDALCVVTTGGALTKRTLYSDTDEEVIELMRPIIANGIDDVAKRPDLAERSIAITLKAIDRTKRRSEREIWSDFHDAAPRILGALLDGIAHGLAHAGPPLNELDRMADWLTWVAACEEGVGFAKGTMLGAYRRNRGVAVDVNLEASPVASAIRELLARPDQQGRWEGTAKALLDALTPLAGESTKRHRSWPKIPNALSGELRRITPFLREIGVEVESRRTNKGSWITIEHVRQVRKTHSSIVTSSLEPNSSGSGGDDARNHIVTASSLVTDRELS